MVELRNRSIGSFDQPILMLVVDFDMLASRKMERRVDLETEDE